MPLREKETGASGLVFLQAPSKQEAATLLEKSLGQALEQIPSGNWKLDIAANFWLLSFGIEPYSLERIPLIVALMYRSNLMRTYGFISSEYPAGVKGKWRSKSRNKKVKKEYRMDGFLRELDVAQLG